MTLKRFKAGMMSVALCLSMVITAVPVYAGENLPGG